MAITYKINMVYTLIELLTVVTIIGILLSIAIPHYISHRDTAKMATIYSTLHQIRLAQEDYKSNHEIYFGLGDTVISNDDSPVEISGSDLVFYIPNGQLYQI